MAVALPYHYRTLLCLVLASLCFGDIPTNEGSLLPLLDTPASLLSDLWPDRFPHPFRVLEQIPLELERDNNMALSPAREDWKETPEGHVISLDIPGLKKDEIKIQVEENRVLRVSGERKREEEKKGDHWHRLERSYGKFWRHFRLPGNVDLDSVKAKLEDGVLTINLNNCPLQTLNSSAKIDPKVFQDASFQPQHFLFQCHFFAADSSCPIQ